MKKKKLKGGNNMNKTLLGVIAISMIALVAVAGVAAFGFGNGFENQLTDEEKTAIQEQRQAMQTAIESGDYETWKSLMNENMARMQSQITEESFQQIQERHSERAECREKMQTAMESGDEATIESVREECGMNERNGFGKGPGMGKSGEMKGMQKGLRSCPYIDSDSSE